MIVAESEGTALDAVAVHDPETPVVPAGPERHSAPRSRRVTLVDLADAIGLHPSTVSRALDPRSTHLVSGATLERVRDAAATLGYRGNLVARSLRRRRTDTIGVVVADLRNTVVTSILNGLDLSLGAAGYLTMIGESGGSSSELEELLRHLVAGPVDAIVVTAATTSDGPLLRRIAEVVPLVVALRPVSRAGLPVVAQDDYAGGALVAEHFAGLRHELVAQLPGPASVGNFVRRRQGFSATCRALHVVEVPGLPLAAEPTAAEGARLTEAVLRGKHAPTAIFAHNDAMAMGALRVLRRRGLRCPEDMAIAGYNNASFVDLFDPPLTSVVVDVQAVSSCAGRLALQWLADGVPPVAPVLPPPVLIPRASTVS